MVNRSWVNTSLSINFSEKAEEMVLFLFLTFCSPVVPVFKRGDSAVLSNYRSVSLTIPMLAKLLESIIKKQLVNSFEHFNLFTDDQEEVNYYNPLRFDL